VGGAVLLASYPVATLHIGKPTPAVGLPRPTTLSPFVDICPLSDLPPGASRIVEVEDLEIGIEDRCSHDNGILLEGDIDFEGCTVECPRHGSLFDLRTGKPLNLPAYVPVDTYEVVVEDEMIRVAVD